MGLDLGEKRVGIAIAEAPAFVPVPLAVISPADEDVIVSALKDLTRERNVKKLIIGIPYESSGRKGKMARQIARQAKRLSETLGIPYQLVDERLTSKAAESYVRLSGTGRRKHKNLFDAISATLILETYLRQKG